MTEPTNQATTTEPTKTENANETILKLAETMKSLESKIASLEESKKFFNALPTITTFESFIDLVESIFLSREVTVTYLAPAKITITVNNHNAALLKYYQDKMEKNYIDNKPKNYIGFKEQDFLGLEAFFKKFLEPFLPAGVILASLTIKQQKETK